MSIKAELRKIKRNIEKEHVSYSELAFLENHKKEIMELQDIVLAEWSGITEEEWIKGELKNDYITRLEEEIDNAFEDLDNEDLDALFGTLLEIKQNILPHLGK